jgi:sec-independent protein translocase protein TatA
MFGLGIQELLIILVIVMVIFGAGRLPDIGRDLGKAIKGFKKAVTEKEEIDVTPKQNEIDGKKKGG